MWLTDCKWGQWHKRVTPRYFPGTVREEVTGGWRGTRVKGTALFLKHQPLFFSLAGTLHSITIFSLSSLLVSLVIAFLGTLIGRLPRSHDYEVSCQPAFPPLVLPSPWGQSPRIPS